MPKNKYDPKKDWNKPISKSDDKEKTFFFYYLANEISSPKLKSIYDYSETYKNLKDRFMPKSTSDLNNIRNNWNDSISSWIKEIYQEIIKFCFKEITYKELSDERLNPIRNDINDKDSRLFKMLSKVISAFEKKDIIQSEVENLSLKKEILKKLLIRYFIIDFIDNSKHIFNKDNLEYKITLVRNTINNTPFDSPYIESFIDQIEKNLRTYKLVRANSTKVLTNIKNKLKKQPLKLEFDFTQINEFDFQSNDLKTYIEEDLKNNEGKNWKESLSDKTKELIIQFGVYDLVFNKLTTKYNDFTKGNDRQKEIIALKMHKELNPFFTRFDEIINDALTKFGDMLLEKRNKIVEQLPDLVYNSYGLKNYITILPTGFQFEINNFKELMSSFWLTIRSFHLIYKRYLREVYFYPLLTTKDINSLKDRSKKFNFKEKIYLPPKKATFNYHLIGLGIVPVNFELNLTGIIDPYMPDFGKYQDEIKLFEELNHHQKFFQLLKCIYQVNPRKLKEELNLYFANSPQQKQMAIQKLTQLAICLFVVEGIRNTGSLITNLINLDYLPKEQILSLNDKLNENFPMTKVEAANKGRSLEHQYTLQPKSFLGSSSNNDDMKTFMKHQNKVFQFMNYKTFEEATIYVQGILASYEIDNEDELELLA